LWISSGVVPLEAVGIGFDLGKAKFDLELRFRAAQVDEQFGSLVVFGQ
jgi:hypothetical protein